LAQDFFKTKKMKHKIEVCDYDPKWKSQYESLAAEMWLSVSEFSARIEHVGSTSVVGLWAKPIIDMDIVLNSRAAIPSVISALAGIGYKHIGDLGIKNREAFTNSSAFVRHNLYATIDGCLSFRNHITIRDHLRKHEADREIYSALKRKLAEEHPEDIDAYTEEKSEFLISILERYEISENDLDLIRAANKK